MVKMLRKIWPIFLVVFFIFLVRLGFFSEGFKIVVSGMNKAHLSVSRIFNYFIAKRELASENQKLREEILKLKLEISQLKILKEENEILRENFNFIKSSPYQVKLVNIIGKRAESNSIFYLLDQGENSGFQKGLAVAQANGYLVGKIFKVEKNFSLFLPLTSNYFSVAVDIVSQDSLPSLKKTSLSPTTGLAQGKYGTLTEIDLVPQDKEVKVGDFVITSGLEELVPRGLFLGSVGTIEQEEGKLFKKVILNTPIKSDELRIVGVVLK